LSRARGTIEKNLDRQVKKGLLDSAAKDAALGRIATSTVVDGASDASLVIEAASENADLKFRLFSDLDRVGSGKVRFFDAAGHDLGTYLAPPSPGGFSFLGVRFPDRVVARVEIISGHGALGADSFDASSEHRGPTRDLAIMDDFLYGEPVAIEAQTTTTERAGTPR